MSTHSHLGLSIPTRMDSIPTEDISSKDAASAYRLEDAEQAVLSKVEHASLKPRPRQTEFWAGNSDHPLDAPSLHRAMATISPQIPRKMTLDPRMVKRASMIMDMVQPSSLALYAPDLSKDRPESDSETTDSDDDDFDEEDDVLVGEDLPLLGRLQSSLSRSASVAESTRMKQSMRSVRTRRQKRWKQLLAIPRCLYAILLWVLRTVFCTTLVVAITCHVAAWIFYYHLGNPIFDFLPGKGTFCWWLNHVGRQCIVFELGRGLQWLVIDWFATATNIGPRVLGPITVIVMSQAKGLPSSVLIWGLLDVAILHGTNPFQLHWLYWTDIEIYTKGVSGDKMLSSPEYTKFILCLLIWGMAGIVKNTFFIIYFGRRNVENYRPQLEEILNDAIVISEIAELSEEAASMTGQDPITLNDSLRKASDKVKNREWQPGSDLHSEHWQNIKFTRHASSDSRNSKGSKQSRGVSRHSSRSSQPYKLEVKRHLDRWSEPLNKADGDNAITLEDIYKFRKALHYMDMVQPFSPSFGMASTRDECIASAEKVYKNLLKLCSDGGTMLDHDVLKILTEKENSEVDKELAYTMRHLFRPDKNNKLSLVEFVQACDTVYKRIRFFRASVGNASIIDSVLEGLINGLYQTVLFLLVLTILEFDPWPLVVSLSTVLVTFAFAVGPSAAKLIEGVAMIVIQRPYDIGDRIVISDQPGKVIEDTEDAANSWFVEDISLYTTVIRYAPTNEIATVTNGSIAKSRIVNCARSKQAKLNIDLKFHFSIQEPGKLAEYRKELERYVADHNQAWKDVIFMNCRKLDPSLEAAYYLLRLQSRRSWQSTVPILEDKSELVKFCGSLAKRLGVKYEEPKPTQIMYVGGYLQDGAIKDYKSNLLNRDNLLKHNESSMNVSLVENPDFDDQAF